MLNRLALVSVLLWTSASSLGFGQNQLDLSYCFNTILTEKVDYNSDVRLALASLAQISESTFESSKRDLGLAGRYGIISGSLDYSSFDTRRREYFNLNKLDLEYYKTVSLSTRTLNPKAYGLIEECIKQVAAHQYGFHYLAVINDETSASLQFFWRGTPGSPAMIKITDSIVENATAAGAPTGKLFPFIDWWHFFTPYPGVGEASTVILLRRKDAGKPIVASVTTSPQVNTVPIRILPVPKIVTEPTCQTVYDTVDPVTGKEYLIRRAFPLHDHITDAHGCSDCHGFVVGVDAPGPIYRTTCELPNPYAHQEICTSEGAHATLSGYHNADSTVYLNVYYKVPRVECTYPKK